jgi:hypothetical protein
MGRVPYSWNFSLKCFQVLFLTDGMNAIASEKKKPGGERDRNGRAQHRLTPRKSRGVSRTLFADGMNAVASEKKPGVDDRNGRTQHRLAPGKSRGVSRTLFSDEMNAIASERSRAE